MSAAARRVPRCASVPARDVSGTARSDGRGETVESTGRELNGAEHTTSRAIIRFDFEQAADVVLRTCELALAEMHFCSHHQALAVHGSYLQHPAQIAQRRIVITPLIGDPRRQKIDARIYGVSIARFIQVIRRQVEFPQDE